MVDAMVDRRRVQFTLPSAAAASAPALKTGLAAAGFESTVNADSHRVLGRQEDTFVDVCLVFWPLSGAGVRPEGPIQALASEPGWGSTG
jgi:hypothetical protein